MLVSGGGGGGDCQDEYLTKILPASHATSVMYSTHTHTPSGISLFVDTNTMAFPVANLPPRFYGGFP
ncbi:Uncharacterized protein HZ326_2114 [Fusarium oxysporum f. sp. albedinis]|nr:Uncharacterized protein HZ326_2114 [Fusarium oxysporum f. sp. albedinis]